MKVVTQVDIARTLGVSQTAVGYALGRHSANSPIKLSQHSQQRILEAARQMRYVPNRSARSLKLGRTNTILLATAEPLHNVYIHELVEEIEAELVDRGYEVLLRLLHRLMARTPDPEGAMRTFSRAYADGAILLGTDALSVTYEMLVEKWPAELPVVNVGPGEHPRISSVSYDRVKATELGVGHLFDQGHRRIALVFDAVDRLPSQQRLQGYRAALAKGGVEFDESLLFRTPADCDVKALWTRIANVQPRPTAMFCYNDELALRLIQIIHRVGLRVPQDIALVTLNNSRLACLDEVPLTAVDINNARIAQAVVETLLERIKKPDAAVRHILVEPHLVVRASSAGTQTNLEKN